MLFEFCAVSHAIKHESILPEHEGTHNLSPLCHTGRPPADSNLVKGIYTEHRWRNACLQIRPVFEHYLSEQGQQCECDYHEEGGNAQKDLRIDNDHG